MREPFDPVDARPEPGDTTADPADPRPEPGDTTADPADPRPEPGDTTADPVDPAHDRSWSVPGGWVCARCTLWVTLTFAVALDARDRLRTHIPGDIGDSYLVLALLKWGGDRSTELYSGYWQGPMFAGARNVMAYSETFLALTIPFKLLELLTGSAVLAFNLLYVSSWVLCGEATYALGVRLFRSRPAAVVAAAAFTFSTIRVGQSNHFQLAWAGLVPLSFLLLFRFWDRPTVGRGLALAGSVIALMLTSAYYGVIVIVVVGIAVTTSALVDVAREHRGWRTRWSAVRGAAACLVTIGIPMLFVRYQYAVAAEGSVDRSLYPAPYVLRPGDLRSPPPTTTFLDAIWFLDDRSAARSSENHAYVGAIALVAIPMLIALVVWRRRDVAIALRPVRQWAVVAGAAALAVGIAVGRGPVLGIEMPFYDIARRAIPGIEDMVALVRLFLFAQLALAMASGLVIAWLLGRIRSHRTVVAICAGLVAVVAVEAAMSHPMIQVVQPAAGSVNEYLEQQDDGVVVLLPMVPLEAGILHPFIEGPRLVLGRDDDLRSVNGYSGYAPLWYGEAIANLNRFPDPSAIAEAERRSVRWVVIYTGPLDVGDPSLNEAINGSGQAFWSRDEAERRIGMIPPGLVAARYDGVDGIVLDLGADPGR